MDQENSEMHSEDTSCSPTAMSRTSYTDLVGDSIENEDNIYDLPEYKIKMEVVEEDINNQNIAICKPENLDTTLDFEASQSREQYFIKQEVFENPEKHPDNKESFNIHILCKNEPTDFSEFICTLCKETFTCKDSFEEHSRTHSKPTVKNIKMEVYPCELSCRQCGGELGSKESWESHQLEHRKDVPCPKKPKLDDMEPTTAEVTSAAEVQEAADSSTATIIETEGDFENAEDTGIFKRRKRKKSLKLDNEEKKTNTNTANMLKQSGTKNNDKITCAVKKQSKCYNNTTTVNATDSMENEENIYDLPEYKIKMEIVEEHICDDTAMSEPEKLDTILDFKASQSKEQYLIKQEVSENPVCNPGNNTTTVNAADDMLTCDICDYTTVYVKHLNSHLRAHTAPERSRYSCDLCSYLTVYSRRYVAHVRTHTGEKPFSCNICEKQFLQKSGLRRHELTHKDEKPFSCNICDRKFKHKDHLKSHELTHTDGEPYFCSECEKKFFRKSDYKRHILTHTGEKPFSCNVCEKKFLQKSDVRRHELTHKDEKPFSCDVCDKKFNHKHHLKAHELTHTGGKPYFCNECDKKFFRKSDLKRHILTHTGEKPFSCNVCDRKFMIKSDLKRHELAHTGEKPFSCNECEKKYTKNFYLKRHLFTHTGKKPYHCTE